MSRLSFVLGLGVAVGLFSGTAFAQEHGQGGHGSMQEPMHGSMHDQMPADKKAALEVPSSIRIEHEHLHHQLDAALKAGGKTAEAAQKVADVLGPHFKEEEAYAMPPLGLLEAITQNKPISQQQAQQAIQMADKLRANYPQMIEEHQQIQQALRNLAAAAKDENQPEAAAFAEALMAHAGNEEQILYPTTLLIGEFLKLQQNHSPADHGAHQNTTPDGH
jgi:hypothetical protein